MKEKILSCIQNGIMERSMELRPDSVLEELVDSITFVKIVVALEEEFDFEFEDEMLSASKFEKVQDLINYVERCLE